MFLVIEESSCRKNHVNVRQDIILCIDRLRSSAIATWNHMHHCHAKATIMQRGRSKKVSSQGGYILIRVYSITTCSFEPA